MAETSTRISFLIPIATHLSIHPGLEDWLRSPLLKDHEVILVLDESREFQEFRKNRQLLDRITTTTIPNLIILETRAGLPGIPRNKALSIATGEWVFFWDADDLPHLDQSINLVHQAEESGADAGVGLAEIVGSSVQIIGNSWRHIYKWPGLWRFTFKTQLIRELQFEDWAWCEDQNFLVQALRCAKSIYKGQEVVYTYSLHNTDSLTSKHEHWVYIEAFLQSLQKMEQENEKSLLPVLFHLKAVLALARYVSVIETVRNLLYLVKVIVMNRPLFLPKLSHHFSGRSRS